MWPVHACVCVCVCVCRKLCVKQGKVRGGVALSPPLSIGSAGKKKSLHIVKVTHIHKEGV